MSAIKWNLKLLFDYKEVKLIGIYGTVKGQSMKRFYDKDPVKIPTVWHSISSWLYTKSLEFLIVLRS